MKRLLFALMFVCLIIGNVGCAAIHLGKLGGDW